MPFGLPQHASEPQREQRRAVLSQRKDAYQWVSDTGLPPHSRELPAAERLDERRKKTFLPRIAQAYANRLASQATSRLRKWDSFESYGGLFPMAERPALFQRWQDDGEFARQRVAGVNPLVIRLCAALPENFRVSEAHVRGLLPAGTSLAAEVAQGRMFLCDYAVFDEAPCVPGRYLAAPMALLHLAPGGVLRPIAIQLGQDPSRHPVITPNDGKWPWQYAKTVIQVADHHHQQLLGHLLTCHYFMEPFWVAANRQLAPSHPVRELLAPHFRFTMFFDKGAREVVCNATGSFQQLKATGLGGSMTLMRKAYRSWQFSELGLRASLVRRGVESPDVLPDYPYRDEGLRLHAAIARYVADMLEQFYQSPADLIEDIELQAWAAELVDPRLGGIKGLPGDGRITTVEQLQTICTDLIFRASAYHGALSDGQAEEMCCVPNIPFALYRPLPTDVKAIDEAFVVASLPDRAQAIRQVFIVHVATSAPVYHLGAPDPNYWQGQPAAQARREAFAQEMRDISRDLQGRNRARKVPYVSLDPMRVSESINN